MGKAKTVTKVYTLVLCFTICLKSFNDFAAFVPHLHWSQKKKKKKAVSHTTAAALTGFMSGFMEHLKALLQQLRVFHAREQDLPQLWNPVPE